MDSEDRALLVSRWWAGGRLNEDAREQISGLVETGGEDVVQLLAELIDAAPADDKGVAVGCGPLEDLVHAHGRDLLDELELRWRREPSFRAALSHVWLDEGSFDPATYARLRVVVGDGPARH
jgi:hypothetical protein